MSFDFKFKFNKFYFFGFIFLILVFSVYFFTGMFQLSSIDNRDLKFWSYDDSGIILNSSEFELSGSDDVCWFMIHSYCSTPDEMRELATMVNVEFNDTVVVTRLLGHSETPSKIVNLSLEDWYEQVSFEFDNLSSRCGSVNVVGSSFGGALAIKLSEEREFGELFLINAYVKPVENFLYSLVDFDSLMEIVSPIFNYLKKFETAKINDFVGLENHIAYYNFPFAPVLNSENFLKGMIENFNLIDENVLIVHSVNDDVASFNSIMDMYGLVSSENKEFLELEKSNHVILRDYDSKDVIEKIIEFEKSFR